MKQVCNNYNSDNQFINNGLALFPAYDILKTGYIL